MDFRSRLNAFQGRQGQQQQQQQQSQQRNSPGYSDRGPYNDRSRGYNNDPSPYSSRGGDRRRVRDWNDGGGGSHSRRRIQSPDPDGLGSLRYNGYKIPKGLPAEPTSQIKQQKARHICWMLLCIDGFPYEAIWREWCNTLTSGDDCYVSLCCHAKYPKQVQSDWLRQRLLVHPPRPGRGNSYMEPEYLTRTPNWGSVEITRAMLDLLQAALTIGNDKEADMRFSSRRFVVHSPGQGSATNTDSSSMEDIPPVDQFVWISETCLPVATAPEVFRALQDTTVSWVNARHRKDADTPRNAYENDQFGNIHPRIPGQYRWKADQWVVLCRQHAAAIVNLDRPHMPWKHQLWHSYRDISASDEMYIPTALALLGYLRFTKDGEDTQRRRSPEGEEPTPEVPTPYTFVRKQPITYTDWSHGMRNPKTFTNGPGDLENVARLARQGGCLLARKFAPYPNHMRHTQSSETPPGAISPEDWKRIIESLPEMELSTLLSDNASSTTKEDEKPSGEDTPSEAVATEDGKPTSEDQDAEESAPSQAENGADLPENPDEDDPPEVSFLPQPTVNTNDDEDEEGADDDDEEENQLE